MADDIETIFLCKDCQTAEEMANRLANYIQTATKTIDISIYSFSLCPDTRNIVLGALRDRQKAGVSIRIAYDEGTQQDMIPEAGNHDPCDVNTPRFTQGLGFPNKPIAGVRTLMHNKYVVLDAGTPQARVWTGSCNFTDDSWTLQENNILIFHSSELADLYVKDFDELWATGNIDTDKAMVSGEATVQYGDMPAYVLVNFSPGEGPWIDEMIARQIERTERQITIASVVITSGHILGSLLSAMRRGVPIEGIIDRTQMEGVKQQWADVPDNHWKIGAFEEIVSYGNIVGKNSTPYTPTSVHDYMHNKVMVLDDAVITGSYNFSRHAQANAENCLFIKSAPLSESYREYIHKITAMYATQGPQPQQAAPIPAPAGETSD